MLGVRLFILAVTVLVAVACVLLYRPKRHWLSDRTPDRSIWGATYPDDEFPAVMEVLQLVRTAFSLREDWLLRLRPDDRLLDIYKGRYPHGGVDELELEGLAARIRRRYGLDLANRPDLGSLREVIDLCLAAKKNPV